MGILKSVFQIPPLLLNNVANPEHSLTQVLLIVSQHCQKGEGGRNIKLTK